MKLQQLKYLLAIVDNGLNITAAADRLYTSQPGVSKQLKLLEEELGMQLFTRKGKSLHGITDAGTQIIERARLIMQEVDNIRSVASDYYQEEQGSLSIATTHTQARYVLPDVIREFRSRYAKVSLNLHQGTSEQIADMVAANEIDFAIATGSRRLFSSLLLVPSYHWDRKIIVPKGHPLTRLERKLTLHDLAEFPLVTYVFSFGGQSSLKRAFADHGLEPDVVVTGKGLSGGLYPMTATLMTRGLHSFFDTHPHIHISTFGGAEIGCSVALEVLDIVEEPGFLTRVNELADRFRVGFDALPFEQ